MRKALLLLVLLFPAGLWAQDQEVKNRKLMIRVPTLNGAFAFPILERRDSPLQRSISVQTLGTGLWYFNQSKFSYQLDFDMNLGVGRYQSFEVIDNGLPLEATAFSKNFAFVSPKFSFGINMELADLETAKLYAFVYYQLHRRKWQSQTNIAAGDVEFVDNAAYTGAHYKDLYTLQLAYLRWLQQVGVGIAFTGRKNITTLRFFLEYDPAKNYTYTAASVSSEPGPSVVWEERVRAGLSAGFGLAFNIPLLQKK